MTGRTLRLILSVVLLVVTVAGVANGQRGLPPFGTFNGGNLDTVNLQNLNVHLAIPIYSRAGRQIPFSYSLGYDSTVWNRSGSAWSPAQNFGWIANTQTQTGYVTYSASQGQCLGDDRRWYTFTEFSNFYYVDAFGTAHAFADLILDSMVAQRCPFEAYPHTGTSTAPDGSGYSLTATAGTSTATVKVTAPSGLTFNPPTQSGVGTGSKVDPNGNTLTVTSGTSTTITDTLGTTALTITGSGTASSPKVFSYTAPSGATASIQVKYTSLTIKTNFGCTGVSEYGPNSVSMVTEIDLPDYTQSNNRRYLIEYEPTPGYAGYFTGRIAKITLPTGAYISYEYSSGSQGVNCADGTTAGLTRTINDGAFSNPWVYTRTQGTGAAWSTDLGDPLGNHTVYQFQGLLQTQKKTYEGATTGTLLETVDTCYNNTARSSCTTTAVSFPVSRVTQWTTRGSKTSQLDTFYNTGNGLPSEIDEYDFGAATPTRMTIIQYNTALTNGIRDRPASVEIRQANNSTAALTTYGYDETAVEPTSGTPQLLAVTGSRGNLTTIQRSTGTTTLTTQLTYFDTGNVKVVTDVNGAQTTTAYDGTDGCANAFPTTVTSQAINGIALSDAYKWNCTGAVLTSKTDSNGATTSIAYTSDAYYWRPNSAVDPAQNITTITYPDLQTTKSSMTFNGGASGSIQQVKVDALGRTQLTQVRQSPVSSTYDTVATFYDAVGRAYKQTLPYSAGEGQISDTAPAVLTQFDALSRPMQVTDAGGGTTQYTYNGNDVLLKLGPAPANESFKQRQLEFDGLGRLTSVCEITSASDKGTCGQTSAQEGYWTKYLYGPLNTLEMVVQNAQSTNQQRRTFFYDRLRRLTKEINAENGTTTYTYDSDATCGDSKGDLVRRVDNAGNITCNTFDKLHRITRAQYTVASGWPAVAERNFVYDVATVNGVSMQNTKGRLAQAYTGPSSSKLTDVGIGYSSRGEIVDVYEKTPNSGGYYHTGATYWPNGVPHQITIPGVPLISYQVDGEGRTSTVVDANNTNLVSSCCNYNPFSSIELVTFGSGDSDSYTYNQSTGRLTRYQANVGSKYVQGTLTWNQNGSIAGQAILDTINPPNSQTCNYVYDDLGRISSANCGPTWGQTFSFDPFGNITKDVIPGAGGVSFQAGYSALSNQISSLPGATVQYNANGAITNDGTHEYSWDALGNMLRADSVSITYDALGRAVEQDRNGSYTQIVYGANGLKVAVMVGTTLSQAFVPLPGGAKAIYSSSGLLRYRHADYLGSARVSSTATVPTTTYSDISYAPFGETYNQYGSPDLSFTGQNEDTVPGLYDFLYRTLSPVQGRWLSPDPVGLAAVDASAPQTWNRYGYVLNSPLQLVDPDGTCTTIFAGITQSPTSEAGQALIALAEKYNANVVFGYSGQGKVASVMSVLWQGWGGTNGGLAAGVNALNNSAGGAFPAAIAYSGGAQTLVSASSRIARPNLPQRIAYLSPGLGIFGGGPLLPGTDGTTDIWRGDGPTDAFVNFTSPALPGMAEHDAQGCGHDLKCELDRAGPELEELLTKAGPCDDPKIYTRQNQKGTPLRSGRLNNGGVHYYVYRCFPMDEYVEHDVCILMYVL